jgi:hypothetical protein
VVADNFNVGWSRAVIRPFKTNPPLIVDADAVLSFPITGQGLKTIAGQSAEILQASGRSKRSSFNRAARSIRKKALTRLPLAKSMMRLYSTAGQP